jgi:CHASE2 domain-containing sensor protein
MKKILTHWTLAFITLAVLMWWGLKDPFVKETARLKSFDLIQKYDTPTMSEDVVIVEIDEKSHRTERTVAMEEYGTGRCDMATARSGCGHNRTPYIVL